MTEKFKEKSRAKRLRDNGISITRISEIVGIPYNTVWNWLNPEKVKESRKQYYSTEHGREMNRNAAKRHYHKHKHTPAWYEQQERYALRRQSREYDTLFVVDIDGVPVEVNMIEEVLDGFGTNDELTLQIWDLPKWEWTWWEQTREDLRNLNKRNKKLGLDTYVIDHLVPLCMGGLHHPINTQIITKAQNSKKGKKMEPEAVQTFATRLTKYFFS